MLKFPFCSQITYVLRFIIEDVKDLPNFNHSLLIFEGVNGLQAAIESDEKFESNNAEELLGYYIDRQANVGSLSVRSEVN